MPPPVTPDVPEPARVNRSRLIRFAVLTALIVAVFVALLYAVALPVVPDQAAFGSVRWSDVAGFTLLTFGALFLRSARWHMLLKPLGEVSLREVLTVGFMGYGALILLPLRLGEFVRPALIRGRGGISAMAATGTVGAERVIDGLALSLTLLVALPLAHPLDPLPDHIGELAIPVRVVPGAAYAALLIFISAFAVMGAVYWQREVSLRVIRWVLRPAPAKWSARIVEAIDNLVRGLGFLPRLKYTVPYLLMTAGYWFGLIAGTKLLMDGVGLEGASISRAAVATGVLALGIMVPNSPGFFGAFQLSTYAALAMYFPAEEVTTKGSALVFLLYVVQLGGALVLAAAAAGVHRYTRREDDSPIAVN